MGEWVDTCTLPDLMARAAERWPDADSVVFPSGRQSFAQLDAAAVESARSLAAFGIGRGDHVGLLLPNCREYVELMLGATMLGAWVVPINSRYKAHELAHVIADADIKVLVTTDATDEFVDFSALVTEALPALAGNDDARSVRIAAAPLLRSVVVLGAKRVAGMVAEGEFRAAASATDARHVATERSRVRLRDVAIMMYTSGTTAMPKGCPLSHEALVRTAVEAGRTRFELREGDRMWDPLPMFHMSFVLPFIACLDAGAALLVMERFEPTLALRYMEREQATVNFASFPTITQALLTDPTYDPSKLCFRLVNNVAPPDVLRSMQAAMPFAKQISAYGLTEAGGVVAFGRASDSDECRATTSGRPFRGIEVVAKDVETGAVLPPGEQGELCIRGYCLFEGYYKDPAKNAEAIDAEGFLHTGDLGFVDADGYVAYRGRVKDMLKVGGENVAAVEIESYLATHPAVLLAQVVSAPDAKYGEVAAAFVQLRPGMTADADELIEHCRGRIASFKVPRHVRFVDDWPMSATKIQKYRLRERIAEELGASGN
jgi:fatty-acyl-CoA synthase